MKATLGISERRIEVKENVFDGIISYDTPNDYPQRMLYTIATSGVAISCVNLYQKYIRGRGFVDKDFNKVVLNRKGETALQILDKVCKDISRHKGFILHFNYNILGQIVEINHVPFAWGRFTLPDDSGYIGQIKIYPDWNKVKYRRYDKTKAAVYDTYNPDPNIIKSQIERDGGVQNYRGQVLYYSFDGKNEYPLAPFDSVIKDIEADGRSKTYKLKAIKSGFLAGHILKKKGRFQTAEDRNDFMDTVKSFQGEEQTNAIMLIETEVDEELPELSPLAHNIDDKLFSYTETSATQNIIQAFGQPPVLLGILNNTSNGDSNSKYAEAKKFYDEYTIEERSVVSELFRDIITKSIFIKLNKTGDFSLIPQSGIVKEGEKKPLIDQLQIGGTQALQAILLDGTLTPEQKIAIVRIVFGASEEDSIELVTGKKTNVNV